MKKFLILLFCVLGATKGFAQASKIWEVVRKDLLTAVIQINSNGASGTGFIVCDSAFKKFYLITNKHVIGKWNMGDSLSINNKIEVISYGANTPYNVEINLKSPNGKILPIVKTHPSKDVDIAVIKLVNNIKPNEISKYRGTAFLLSFLKSYKELTNEDLGLSIGSSVFAIGYPLGLKNISTNEPIAKHGYISSDLSNEFSIPTKNGIFKGKVFFVDGLITHGNSGSPVITPQIAYMPLRTTQNYIIGIVSHGWGGSGITVIYSTDYIKEVMNLFND